MAAYVSLLRFLVAITVLLCALASKCHTHGNIKILSGYHCFSDNQRYLKIIATHHHLCRPRCLANKQCSFVQYNKADKYCLLANGPCLWLEPDTNYDITFMRTNSVEKCLDWVPHGEVANAARQPDACYSWGIQCTVGRIYFQSNVLPGNGVGNGVISVLNGGDVRYGKKEYLDVQPGCKVSWVSFTSGDPVPDVAVQGGYLDNSGSPQLVYVMGAISNGRNCKAYGYYNPDTERGYFEFWGVYEFTQMYLMVIETI